MNDRLRNDHGNLIRQALDDSAGARSALAASWRRSITLHGLDPMRHRQVETITDLQLREAQQAMEPVTRAAEGVLDRLFQAVGGVGCCVLLTNTDGIPVERRGAVADDQTFHRWGLWPGAVWSEAVEGTNGIGTALAEHRPVTIHRDQHFHARNTGLSCVTYPVHDHLGRLVGSLDVSSCRADATESILGLISTAVADAVRAIEAQTFRQAFSDARIVLAGDATERNHAALLAVDRDDLVPCRRWSSARRPIRLASTKSSEPTPKSPIPTVVPSALISPSSWAYSTASTATKPPAVKRRS